MTYLTKADILAAQDLKRETVDVPEWGGSVLVRELNGREAEQVAREYMRVREAHPELADADKLPQPEGLRIRVCGMGLCDEEGERLFSDAELDLLGRKHPDVLSRIYPVVMRLSGMWKEDGKPTAEEQAEGESAPGQSDGSSSV
jgi:hypothetical protein